MVFAVRISEGILLLLFVLSAPIPTNGFRARSDYLGLAFWVVEMWQAFMFSETLNTTVFLLQIFL